MKKWKTGALFLGIMIMAGTVFLTACKGNDNVLTYRLGKIPGYYLFTFSEDVLLYKDNVIKDGKLSYTGLYMKKWMGIKMRRVPCCQTPMMHVPICMENRCFLSTQIRIL